MYLSLMQMTNDLNFNTSWAEDIFKLIFIVACFSLIFLFVKIIIKWRI